MPKYLLVAVDIDGTLLTSDKDILPDTIESITEASKKGIHIVYCSGRSPVEMQSFTNILNTVRYGICMSGALVYDFKEQKIIYINSIPKEYIKEIIKVSLEDDAMVQLLTEKESIVRKDQITHMEDFQMKEYYPMYIKICKTVNNMETEAENYDFIPKINIYFHTRKERQKAYEKIKELPLSFAFGGKTALEITADSVTKGNSLTKLAKYLDIPMEKVIGIGDGDNDISFLSIVGLPIAMGNANENVKAICKDITDDNNHNGTGKAIYKYCLDKK